MQRFKKVLIFLFCALALTTLAESRAADRQQPSGTLIASGR
jgi:hypothetical protein